MRRDELVEEALDTLPEDLDETYIRIVQRVEHRKPAMKDLALRALMWILYAKRPLLTEEFQYALATERAFHAKTDIDPDSIDVILEACGNLVVQENGIVRPTHYSVQEFFTKPRSATSQEPIQRSLVNSSLVHETLACVCMKYMQLEKLDAPCQDPHIDLYRRRQVTRMAFAWYATRYFDYHIQKAMANLSPELSGLLEDLLQQDGLSLAAILQLEKGTMATQFMAQYFPISVRSHIRLLKVQSSSEPYNYSRSMRSRRWLGNAAPKYALHHASRTGSLNAVRWLLDLGIQVDEQDDEGISPIYYACRHGGPHRSCSISVRASCRLH